MLLILSILEAAMHGLLDMCVIFLRLDFLEGPRFLGPNLESFVPPCFNYLL